jgi:hypothetical protein
MHLINMNAEQVAQRAGLEITRIASQIAMQYMSVAMQLKSCIAVGCDKNY